MHITWHGNYTVKLQTGDTVIVIDPHPADGGLPAFRGKGDVVALSNPEDEHMSQVSGIQGEPKILNTPGEYSLRNISLTGISWIDSTNNERSVQRWLIEKMVILHVGALEGRQLTAEELQQIEITGIDILLLPVGGGSGLNTSDAIALLTTIEPRLVIPINYAVGNTHEDLASIDQFAKEMGVATTTAEKKLLIKPNTLPQDELQTIILAP